MRNYGVKLPKGKPAVAGHTPGQRTQLLAAANKSDPLLVSPDGAEDEVESGDGGGRDGGVN